MASRMTRHSGVGLACEWMFICLSAGVKSRIKRGRTSLVKYPGQRACALALNRFLAGFERIEVLCSELQLITCGFSAVDDASKGGIFRSVLGVPAQVLTRYAHAHVLAIEGVQVSEVAKQYVRNIPRFGCGQLFCVCQKVRDFLKDPGSALGSAADHQSIRAGKPQDLAGF